jgi:hypothetical protein
MFVQIHTLRDYSTARTGRIGKAHYLQRYRTATYFIAKLQSVAP